MPSPRIIVALDFPDATAALAFVSKVMPSQCRLKVGLELFSSGGPDVLAGLISRGFDVFLDLKYHDIPSTVANACVQAAKLGVWMVNVHALGGKKMMRAAREAIDRQSHRPLLTGVTLLTSHNDDDMGELGLEPGTAGHVDRLAALAQSSGLDGVICSPMEAALLRRRFAKKFLLVTPGIRPSGSDVNDQQRTRTPAEAVGDGADYLVIGRPITQAADPVTVLDSINREIEVL